ncbi:MFS transporter [Microbacterium nymphoidis]|uniref:MFS transporter n=1 Tax=Microbacterium nymphoidis TaxID=2898586 RepID=UPI001E50A966|nr:MFS transporter [Microbacterium nymphoidis]MCD2499461.1 MFS transporter [Microbacterium nymphoidis]
MDAALRRRRMSLFVLFFVPGMMFASWVTRTPDVRDLLEASTATMGLVLFGLSVGSMLGILSSGALTARFGTRPVITVGISLQLLATPTIGAGAAIGSAWLTAIGLGLMGLGMGGAEVAMNVEGAEVEQLAGVPVLPALHGSFSLGTVAGAVIGLGAVALHLPVLWHLLMVTVIAVLAVLRALPGVPRSQASGPVEKSHHAPVWRDRRLLIIGVIVLALALAEGSANDWLPLLMVDGHGFDPAWSSGLFAVFAAMMTIGRFSGGPLITRFGRAAVLGGSAALGAVGLALVIFADNPVVAACAIPLWGLGAALGFPVAISAAGDSGPNSAARVSLVATIGYVAFLAGPPALGFLGEHFGLRLAMILVLVLVALAVTLTPALRGIGAAETEDAARQP